MTSRAHLDAIYENLNMAKSIFHSLCDLSDSFDAVGNEKMANKLYNIGDKVYAMAQRLQESHTEMQEVQLRTSHDNMANILTAFAAGASK